MAIRGSAEVAAHQTPPGAPAPRFLATIMTAVGRAATLTQRLLAFGRVQTLDPQAIDVNEALQAMQGLLTTTLGGLAELALVLDRSPAVAVVDPPQFEQAVLNLVINARDAMPAGGAVAIRTSQVEVRDARTRAHKAARKGSFVMLEVEDTGCGIDPRDLGRIFEPFFTTKAEGEGTGLGLALAYSIVEAHQGQLLIDSPLDAATGRGTKVTVLLPKWVESTQQSTQTDDSESETG